MQTVFAIKISFLVSFLARSLLWILSFTQRHAIPDVYDFIIIFFCEGKTRLIAT